MKYYRKIIKIGNSKGVTIPSKDCEWKDIKVGDWVEIQIKKLEN